MKKILFVGLLLISSIAHAQATGTATLTWLDNSAQNIADNASGAATGFNIYRANLACPADGSTPAGMALIKAQTTLTPLTYADTGLAPGAYCYYVKVSGPGGESAGSNTAGKPIFGAPSGGVTLIVK